MPLFWHMSCSERHWRRSLAMSPGRRVRVWVLGVEEQTGAGIQIVFTILIADRNPHVRGFLQREMSKEGYRIRLAESAQDLLQWVCHPEPIDLIILDPDLPDAVDVHLLNALQNRMPSVPVIIHTHYSQS